MPHILLIDDDDLFRTMLCATLRELGHTVTEARNGKEGLALHARGSADIVLTDLIMPEKEGLETIMELRKRAPGVKIIAMSGGGRLSGTSYLPVAKQLGACQVLHKPFDHGALAAAITQAIGAAG